MEILNLVLQHLVYINRNKCIDNYLSNENQELLKLQRETINKTYSWEARSKDWIDFLKLIKN